MLFKVKQDLFYFDIRSLDAWEIVSRERMFLLLKLKFLSNQKVGKPGYFLLRS